MHWSDTSSFGGGDMQLQIRKSYYETAHDRRTPCTKLYWNIGDIIPVLHGSTKNKMTDAIDLLPGIDFSEFQPP